VPMIADPRVHILTVDLEDWYHCLEPEPQHWREFEPRIDAVTDHLLLLLQECNAEATFFVLGDVAENHPALIRRILSGGHEIGSHGWHHRFIYAQERAEFREDVFRSIHLLQDLTGLPVRSYRAPYFSVTKASLWALDILRDLGIANDSSIFPIMNPRYGIPDAPRTPHEIRPGLMEWPISTLPMPLVNIPFCGGFYLRLLPWSLVRLGIRILERREEPLLVYIHPWELDRDQPHYQTGSRFLNFRHYYGLNETAAKLRSMLQQTRYSSLASMSQRYRPRV
jgi:polysaccharide deacetylase family protein (PEP-CTERM system associated)